MNAKFVIKLSCMPVLCIGIFIHTLDTSHTSLIGKAFSKSSASNQHFRIHTGEKLYECNTCDKSFSQVSALNTHTKIHAGEKPYECDTCGKAFLQFSALNQHFTIHSGEKQYTFNTWSKTFSQVRIITLYALMDSSFRFD